MTLFSLSSCRISSFLPVQRTVPIAKMRLYLTPIPNPPPPPPTLPKTTTPTPPPPPSTSLVSSTSSTTPTPTTSSSLFTTDLTILLPPAPLSLYSKPSTTVQHKFKTYICYLHGEKKIFSVSEDSHVFSTGNMKYSPRKLNMIARQIKGLSVKEAMKQMQFSCKKPSNRILSVLKRIEQTATPFSNAPDHAWHLSRVWVGKGRYEYGFIIHGKGLHGKLTRPYSHMKLEVKWSNVELAPNRGNQSYGKGGFNVQLKPDKVKLGLHDHKIYAKGRKFFYDA